MKHVLDSVPAKRVIGVGLHTATLRRQYPRWEPYAGKPLVRILGGEREVTRVPTAKIQIAAMHESEIGREADVIVASLNVGFRKSSNQACCTAMKATSRGLIRAATMCCPFQGSKAAPA